MTSCSSLSDRWNSCSSSITVDSDTFSSATCRSPVTSSTGISSLAAISSGVGLRSRSRVSCEIVLPMRYRRLACFWGRRNAPLWSDRAWMMACRTHQTAYVMNLTFFFGLKRLAASISPMFPSLMRSRKDRPQFRYFLAKLTTKRRLASTSLRSASLSPRWMRSPRTFSSSGVIRSSREISWRYFLRVSEETLLWATFSSSISSLLDGDHASRRGLDQGLRAPCPGDSLFPLSQLLPEGLQEQVVFPFHGLHGLLNVQNHLDAGQVDA